MKQLVHDLRSQDKKVRDAAEAALRGDPREKRPRFSVAEGLELLRAATLEFPGRITDWDTPTWIIAVLADEPRMEHLPIVKQIFGQLSLSARERALALLSGIEDAGAAETFIRLFQEHAAEISSPPPLIGLQRRPHHPDVFFPRLLELATHAALRDDIYLTTLAFCEKGLLPAAKLDGHAAPLLAAYRKERDWLLARQTGAGADWRWEGDYQQRMESAGILLDLLGYFPLDQVESELLQALGFRDARLVNFAVGSLLMHGRRCPPAALEAVAASPETRNWLYRKLERVNRMDLFPKQFLTQEALAESDMVQWLAHPTELERTPNEIELQKVVPVETGGADGVLDYYVFKFRTFEPHWAAKKGWMAGVSGPFLRKDAPSPVAYGGTFSEFSPWSAKTPEEHVGDLQELLKDWGAHRRGQGARE